MVSIHSTRVYMRPANKTRSCLVRFRLNAIDNQSNDLQTGDERPVDGIIIL